MMDYAGNGGTDQWGNSFDGQMGNGLDAPVVRSPDPKLKPRPDGKSQRSVSVQPGKQILDGTSKTLLLGEKCLNAQLSDQGPQASDDAGFAEGWDWDVIRWGYIPPSPDWVSPPEGDASLHSAFGSSHPGLFTAGLCDGSVSAISYDVDLEVFKRACSRDDGQVYESEDLR
jgi:hypothetical protein